MFFLAIIPLLEFYICTPNFWNTLNNITPNKTLLSVTSKFELMLPFILVGLTFLSFYLFSYFLHFNESRTDGYIISDWIIENTTSINFNLEILLLTYIPIAVGLSSALSEKNSIMITCLSIVTLLVFRTISLYTFPLQPPADIIPLRDEFLFHTFYNQDNMVKDLFFSGHTAAVCLLAFIIRIKWLKISIFICTVLLASALVLQHVHYLIDVLVAPVFSWASYKIGSQGHLKICGNSCTNN